MARYTLGYFRARFQRASVSIGHGPRFRKSKTQNPKSKTAFDPSKPLSNLTLMPIRLIILVTHGLESDRTT